MHLTNIEDTMNDVFEQFKNENSCTSFGEPQAFIYVEKDRSIEITKKMEGLDESDYYYSVRLHCSNDEFNNDAFRDTMGVIEHRCTCSLDKSELQELILEIIEANKPV